MVSALADYWRLASDILRIVGFCFICVLGLWKRLAKPRLIILLNEPDDRNYQGRPAAEARYLHVRVSNELPPRLLYFHHRKPAVGCKALITFHIAADGRKFIDDEMTGRWARSREPISAVCTNQGTLSYIPDPSVVRDDLDIYAGQQEALDVAARFDQEDECYGWNNESYWSQTLWRSQHWKLPKGEYLVVVTIRTSDGLAYRDIFKLLNAGTRQDFRLEHASKEEQRRIPKI